MKKFVHLLLCLSFCGLLSPTVFSANSKTDQDGDPVIEYLTGDRRLACEAILCMSSGHRPSECTPSLRRYFSIRHRKAYKTRNARRNFLKLCPASNENAAMVSLVNVIVNAGENCTAEALNKSTRFTGRIVRARRVYEDSYFPRYEYYYEPTTERDDQLPQYCKAYFEHELTYFNNEGVTPVYIGVKGQGGFWADYNTKDKAQAQFKAETERRQKIAEETRALCITKRGKDRCEWSSYDR